jgi:hypothetical protein
MSMRDWFWWPTGPTHAAAFAGVFVAITVLGVLGIPHFPTFNDFAKVEAPAIEFAAVAVVIMICNVWFLWLHARGDYLTFSSGRFPVGVTFLVLTLLFPVGWGIYRVYLKGAPLPDFPVLMGGVASLLKSQGPTPAAASEWGRAIRAVFVGEGGLATVLLFSGLWKTPSSDTVEFAGFLARAQPLLRRVFCDGPLLIAAEHKRLQALLAVLAESGGKLDIRALRQVDLDRAGKLAAAAADVGAAVQVMTGSLENLRNVKTENNDKELLAQVRLLLGKS